MRCEAAAPPHETWCLIALLPWFSFSSRPVFQQQAGQTSNPAYASYAGVGLNTPHYDAGHQVRGGARSAQLDKTASRDCSRLWLWLWLLIAIVGVLTVGCGVWVDSEHIRQAIDPVS